jgi:hypothetical protein
MRSSSITRLKAYSDEIFLRWAASPLDPGYELPVEIVSEDDSEPVIRAPLEIGEETPVTLVAKGYMVNGIVRFCRPDRNSYLITVATKNALEEHSEAAYFRDPGALAVDDFLTEEEERKILESLEGSSRSLAGDSEASAVFHLPAAPFRSLHSFLLFSMAAAERLFCQPIPA